MLEQEQQRKEEETVYDELNALVWGFYKEDADNARFQFEDVFKNYDDYIRELDSIMEQMRITYESDRNAVGENSLIETSIGDNEKFSVEDEETLAEFALGDDGHIYLPGQPMLDEFAIGDDGNIYLPGQPMPEAVKRMRAKSLDRDGSAAYDVGNQKGAVDYEQGSIGSETEEIYLRNEREGRPGAHAEDRGRKGSVSETPGEGQRRDTQKGGGKEKLPKSEKEHIVETTKTEGSNWAKSTASQYTKDVYFVSHAALQDTKKKNQRWGVTTGDGIVFLSDQIPDHLGITVGYHEVVHVAKRKRFIPYTDFLADTVSYIDRAEYSAHDICCCHLEADS